jgi:hypothetical protein
VIKNITESIEKRRKKAARILAPQILAAAHFGFSLVRVGQGEYNGGIKLPKGGCNLGIFSL